MQPKADDKRESFQFSLVGMVCLSGVIFLGFWFYAKVLAQASRQQAIARQKERVHNLSDDLEAEFIRVEQLSQSLAKLTASLHNSSAETSSKKQKMVETVLQQIIRSSSSQAVYGVGAWFQPYEFAADKKYFGPYVHRTPNQEPVLTYEWSTDEYAYPSHGWYQAGQAGNGVPIFYEPYLDSGNVWVTTSQGFYTDRKAFAGVVTVDVILPYLRQVVEKTAEAGEIAFLTTKKGAILSHSREGELIKFSRDAGNKPKSILDVSSKSLSDFLSTFFEQKPFYQESTTVKLVDWEMHLVTREDILFANSRLIYRNILVLSLFIVFCCNGGWWLWLRNKRQVLRTKSLQIYSEILEKKVHERTLELENARNMAETASQAKSAFLANMSHELRTPLNSILGYAQILPAMRDAEQSKKAVEVIYRSGSHLLSLINDILDLSKIEAQKLELSLGSIHLIPFLLGIVDVCQIRSEQKGILFSYTFNSDLPIGIIGDEKRLRQVLLNLIGNAIKFTDRGEVNFTVYPSNKSITFSIQDTGIGMTPNQMEKLFQPFEQVGASVTKIEGTGLGLAISQKLAEAMGGSIQVESVAGKGSHFWFSIEFIITEISVTPKNNLPTIIGYEGTEKSILIVDDRESNRSILQAILSPLRFGLIEAENGREGIEKATQAKPDLIITDLIMPVMDGFTMIQALKQSCYVHNIPIIASSASVFHSDHQKCLDLGCDKFLPKPIQVQDLLMQVADLLQLNWIYAQPIEQQKAASIDSLLSPPEDIVQELKNLALRGNFKGIVRLIQRLENENPPWIDFLHNTRHLAESFEEKKLLEFLQA